MKQINLIILSCVLLCAGDAMGGPPSDSSLLSLKATSKLKSEAVIKCIPKDVVICSDESGSMSYDSQLRHIHQMILIRNGLLEGAPRFPVLT